MHASCHPHCGPAPYKRGDRKTNTKFENRHICKMLLGGNRVTTTSPLEPWECWKLLGNFQEAAPAAASAARHGLGVGRCASPCPHGPQVVWGAAWVLVLLGWQCTLCQFGPATGLVAGSFQESSGHPKHVLGGGLPAPKAPAPPGPSPMAHKWCGARHGACRWPAAVRLI